MGVKVKGVYAWHKTWQDKLLGNANYQALGLAARGGYAMARQLCAQTNNNGSIRIGGVALTPAELAKHFARTIPATTIEEARAVVRALLDAELIERRKADGAVLVAEWREDQASQWSAEAVRQQRSRERRRALAEWSARHPGAEPPAAGSEAEGLAGATPASPFPPPGPQTAPAGSSATRGAAPQAPAGPASAPPPPTTATSTATGHDGKHLDTGVTCHGQKRDTSHRRESRTRVEKEDESLSTSTSTGGGGADAGEVPQTIEGALFKALGVTKEYTAQHRGALRKAFRNLGPNLFDVAVEQVMDAKRTGHAPVPGRLLQGILTKMQRGETVNP